MSIINDIVQLPLIGVDWLWNSLDPGRPHPALGLGDMYVSEDDRPRIAGVVDDVLAKQQLGSLDEPAPELVETLRLLATATDEYYAWVNGLTVGFTGAILVSGNGKEAVRMVRDQQAMALAPVPAEKLLDEFLDSIRPAEGAKIPQLSVPKAGFSVEEDTAVDEVVDDEFSIYEGGDDDVDPAARLRELMRAKREAIFQVYTAKRSGGSGRKKVGPYAVVDIVDEGRVVTFVDESGAEPTIKCLPGGRDDLVKVLKEANAALG
ncbi:MULTISPECIES: ESX secretion-associated protein EspG [Thermocrispum]|jgi:hypothetical protein|uniref:ESX secretion-associated protein EspG n=1 Tax=Thermocrispum agreste TaxID=37925 RepID=A0A2W4J5Z7_9PSEU|nr:MULTISPECIES: ESX secretion-associated protein EspG [Thermocrispum]PZM94354.1 MAG: ESX secretion-associated protein EspG [Thermocrispum agreste]